MRQEKPNVSDPMAVHNTVGQELMELCRANGVDYTDFGEGLAGRERLTGRMLGMVRERLGGEAAEYLVRFERAYKAEKAASRATYRREQRAFAGMREVLPLLGRQYSTGADRLDDLLDFFGCDRVEDVCCDMARYRRGKAVEPINLAGWLRRGELEFRKMDLCTYDEGAMMAWAESGAWGAHLGDVAYFKALPEEFRRFGVGLVYVPALPKTVYGAIRWYDGRPLIELSDREHDLASCWFTLFHEMGHAVKHRGADICDVEINVSTCERQEREANKFANGFLFGGDDLRKSVFQRKRRGEEMEAEGMAKEFGVEPMMAAYWLRKAQYRPWAQAKVSIQFADLLNGY